MEPCLNKYKEVCDTLFPKNNNNKKSLFSQELGLIIIGALIFIVSFMWKDFITDLEHIFISKNPSMTARFFYILAVTIIVIYGVVLLRNSLGLTGVSPHSILPSIDNAPDSDYNNDTLDTE